MSKKYSNRSLHIGIMQHNPYLSMLIWEASLENKFFTYHWMHKKKHQSWDSICGEVTISFFIIHNEHWRMHMILLYRGWLIHHGLILLLLTNSSLANRAILNYHTSKTATFMQHAYWTLWRETSNCVPELLCHYDAHCLHKSTVPFWR